MGLLRSFCSAFACAFVLLLVGCGTNPTAGTTSSNSSAAGLTASPQSNGAGTTPQTNGAGTSPQTEGAGTTPQTEGTGPESPQSAGSGGVSVPLAGLPIGGGQVGDNQGNNECVDIAWLGQITHAGVVLTVTGVGFTGQFTTVDPAAAGCPQDHPSCVGSKFTMADNAGTTGCYAGVQYTGSSPSADGTLQLDGSLSCQNVDSATCEKYLQAGQGAPSVDISFTATSTTDGGSPPSDSSSL
jgi:hypothetical protein